MVSLILRFFGCLDLGFSTCNHTQLEGDLFVDHHFSEIDQAIAHSA